MEVIKAYLLWLLMMANLPIILLMVIFNSLGAKIDYDIKQKNLGVIILSTVVSLVIYLGMGIAANYLGISELLAGSDECFETTGKLSYEICP